MQNNSKLKIGVIGVGHLGKHHARILKELKNCELIGICDTNKKNAEKISEAYGIPAFETYEELLEKVEAVTIATPTVTHHDVAMKFLQKGIHTLVEKPLTPTLKEAEELLEASNKNKAILQVGYVERFNGAVLAVKDLIKEPKFIEVHRLSPFPERSTDIGVVLDVMIHDIDILLSLVRSKVTAIDAIGTNVITDKEDIANVRLKFASGCVANVTASRISYQTMRKIRIFSPNSYISVDYQKQDVVVYRKKEGVERITSIHDIERSVPRIRKTEPLLLELEAFVSACTGGEGRAASGEEGRNALELALEICRQIATGNSQNSSEKK
ncbi:TPA: hypothetical protein DEF17_09060 [bacterium]|nr:MAG: hypothetical protein AUJ18_08415 [Candidatus Hydrogenedentes bacterium CG1_02_42_14]HBW48057.1 hypothetical protein [bacterium]